MVLSMSSETRSCIVLHGVAVARSRLGVACCTELRRELWGGWRVRQLHVPKCSVARVSV